MSDDPIGHKIGVKRYVGMVEFLPPPKLKDVPSHEIYEVKPTRPSKPRNKKPSRRKRED